MIKCIAIDDEPLALQLLEDNIKKIPYLQLEATCDNAFEAMDILQKKNIDLIFIDIQMPGLTGLEFVKSMKNKPMVIFVTAYKEYALKSYELDVIDYLMKPVDMSRFATACNKALELYQLKQSSNNAGDADYFFVNVDYSQKKVVFNNILWIEGLKDYIKIFLRDNKEKPLVLRSSIKAIEEQLPANKFMRIHKSFIVSLDKITSVRRNNVFIDDMEIPIGEIYKSNLQEWLTANTKV